MLRTQHEGAAGMLLILSAFITALTFCLLFQIIGAANTRSFAESVAHSIANQTLACAYMDESLNKTSWEEDNPKFDSLSASERMNGSKYDPLEEFNSAMLSSHSMRGDGRCENVSVSYNPKDTSGTGVPHASCTLTFGSFTANTLAIDRLDPVITPSPQKVTIEDTYGG